MGGIISWLTMDLIDVMIPVFGGFVNASCGFFLTRRGAFFYFAAGSPASAAGLRTQ